MNTRVYPKHVFDVALKKLADERKHRLFVEENTRKVLTEKTRKELVCQADLIGALKEMMKADIMIGIRRTDIFLESSKTHALKKKKDDAEKADEQYQKVASELGVKI